jgi:hypothetical protein
MSAALSQPTLPALAVDTSRVPNADPGRHTAPELMPIGAQTHDADARHDGTVPGLELTATAH